MKAFAFTTCGQSRMKLFNRET